MSRSKQATGISSLIGSKVDARPYESFHIYIARIIYANFLNEDDIRRYIPMAWLQLAFAPQNASAELVEAVTNATPGFPSLSAAQAMSATWEIFPALESHPNEYLRYCPVCFTNGHHSYAFQSTLLKECPIHRTALTDRCASCGTPVPWKSHLLYSKSALRCPRGCDLSGRYLNGLIDTPEGMERALGRHFEWMQRMKQVIHFELGPIYIAYPPRQQLEGTIPYRPSTGLTAALCDALRPCNGNVPAFLPFHDASHGEWEFQISGWSTIEMTDPLRREERERMAQTIQRGPYTTKLPLPTSADDRIALNSLASGKKDYRFRCVRQRDRWLLVIPSHLVTNSEVAALFQVLSSDHDDASIDAFYGRLLVELIEGAYDRRCAFDSQQNPPCLDIAERIEGTVRIDSNTYRFTGKTKSSVFGREAWESFTEQTAPKSGTVVFATARGIGA